MSWEDGESSNCHRTPLDDSGIAVDHEEGEVMENSDQSESMLLFIKSPVTPN